MPTDSDRNSKPQKKPMVMAYYPDWAGFDPEKIDFDRFDWIDFAFALPTKDCNLTWDDPDAAPDLLRRLVTAAHGKGKKVKLSVGGWTGSQHFSSVVGTDQSRRTFVQNILTVYQGFALDGIDIDWEYPGHQGEGDNEVSKWDSANFLLFLRLLRSQLPPPAAITAATLNTPFCGSSGQPMKDVSQFAQLLDWILIMNYDVWGASSDPGPNAPLSDACNNSTQPGANAAAAFGAWSSAGFPASKLVLGVPSYGYVSKSTATRLRTRRQTQAQSVQLACDGDQIQFRDLHRQGALIRRADGSFTGAGGFTRYFDQCSSTPYLRSLSRNQIVTYDDPQSIVMKAAFAKGMGMLGTVGWAGFIKVDGTSYSFLGDPVIPAPFQKATQKSMEFTSTQSVFVMSAGAVDLTVTFLSPVEPNDLSKQSFPFSYMAVSATSTDGNSHSVQVYSDISAEWVAGDVSLPVNWTTVTGNTVMHRVQLQNQTLFAEASDRALYGSAFYSTTSGSGMTYQSGEDLVVRSQFVNNSILLNTQDTSFRAISDRWPVFAFAHDLGKVNNVPSTPVVVSVGHVRDPAISYIVAGGNLQDRSSYFWNQFSDISDAITSFMGEYGDALARNEKFDTQVQNDATAISADYAAIVALSIRQTLGATEITISRNADGSFNTTDVLVFMKEISSDGNVNTVDVIFPAYPLLLYVNPLLAKYLLAGLFEYQATGQYPNKFSVHDLGASYPKAVGHNDGADESMPVEESGNMLIMALAYAQKSGDNSQLTTYATLLDQWTQFLIADSLIPESQISTDDFAGKLANQTNLAIKGIVGIKASAVIAGILGDSEKSQNYSSTAASYVARWQTLAVSADQSHLTLSYGDSASWGLSYNLYADKLLKLDLFPSVIYQMQTNWYRSVQQPFGVPLDTRHTYTKSDWQIWTAAIMTDTNARDSFISAVKKTAANGLSSQPLGDWYETKDGTPEVFRARPVVGGHLAFLALQVIVRMRAYVTERIFFRSSQTATSDNITSASPPSASAINSPNAARNLPVPLPFSWLGTLLRRWGSR
ncbi:MPN domain-containing protein [Mycena venus]|uniref:MPN domain-containing protein n=1 Tax=Mycena venus TaxID=2733690 RepID=A0A8H7CZ21_9AGAR|nr:MPN domain-containing protein [Mycena venus]